MLYFSNNGGDSVSPLGVRYYNKKEKNMLYVVECGRSLLLSVTYYVGNVKFYKNNKVTVRVFQYQVKY